MDPFTVRDSLVALLRLSPGVTNVWAEPPDALVPPAVVVVWVGSAPSGGVVAMVEHEYDIEVWPATDLAADGHYPTRDSLVRGVLDAARTWAPGGMAVTDWQCRIDQRDLGQETTRIAVVALTVTEPDICP